MSLYFLQLNTHVVGFIRFSAPPTRAPSVVFVTSKRYTGNLVSEANALLRTTLTQGLDAADALCQAHADAASLPGDYMAWLSILSSYVVNRLPDNSQGYVSTDAVVTFIASNRADLLDHQLTVPIDHDEFGNWVDPDDDSEGSFNWAVWTGSTSHGSVGNPADPLCDNWASNSSSVRGVVGDTRNTGDGTNTHGDNWSRFTALLCSTKHRLYCFQL